MRGPPHASCPGVSMVPDGGGSAHAGTRDGTHAYAGHSVGSSAAMGVVGGARVCAAKFAAGARLVAAAGAEGVLWGYGPAAFGAPSTAGPALLNTNIFAICNFDRHSPYIKCGTDDNTTIKY